MEATTDIGNFLETGARHVVDAARSHAKSFGQKYFRGPHLLLAAVEAGILDHAFAVIGVDLGEATDWCREIAERASSRYAGASSPAMELATVQAIAAKAQDLRRPLTEYDLVGALLHDKLGFLPREMRNSPFSFEAAYLQLSMKRPVARGMAGARPLSSSSAEEPATPGPASVASQDTLSRYTRNLVDALKSKGATCSLPRMDLIRQIAGILGRLNRPNPFIVGDPGVGKSVLVESAMAWLMTDSRPAWLDRCSIYEVSSHMLVAGASYRGQLEERLQQLLDSAASQRDVILFFDDIHVLADPSSTGSQNLLGLFNAYLNRDGFRMIGATTTKNFEAFVRPNEAFLRRFEVVWIKEPSREETAEMIKIHLPEFEKHYGYGMEPDIIKTIITTCERFMPSLRFPGKAISIMDSAFQNTREKQAGKQGEEHAAKPEGKSTASTAGQPEQSAVTEQSTQSSAGKPDTRAPGQHVVGKVTSQDVLEVVARETGIPMSRLSEMEQAKLKELQAYLDNRIYDQVQATKAMAEAIQSLRLGLSDPAKTKVSFILVGPPGTGKTELAKAVAEYLMGDSKALVRFNMSEFQTMESYQRLIGPPPGYVGYDQGGELTNRLMENPYSVVLFDEIEKASTRVYDVLLQVLSDGHLTDNHGRIVDCKNSIFIMTSNALAEVGDAKDQEIRDALLAYYDPHSAGLPGPKFRREFIDRLEIIAFGPLGRDTLNKIALREIKRVVNQVNEGDILKCRIDFKDDVVTWVTSRIDSRATGARSVQRLVEGSVSRLIGDHFVSGLLVPGHRYMLQTNKEDRLDIVETV